MDEMEDKIGAILNNPQMMQQIMSMAQSFSDAAPAQEQAQQQAPVQAGGGPQIDLGMIQKLTGLVRQSGMDKRETALLSALRSYLSADRIQRLEKAMRAAKLAKLASSALGQGTLNNLLGR